MNSKRILQLGSLVLAATLCMTAETEAGVRNKSYAIEGRVEDTELVGCANFNAYRLNIHLGSPQSCLIYEFESYSEVDFLLFGFWRAEASGGTLGGRPQVVSGSHLFFGALLFGQFDIGAPRSFSGSRADCEELAERIRQTAARTSSTRTSAQAPARTPVSTPARSASAGWEPLRLRDGQELRPRL